MTIYLIALLFVVFCVQCIAADLKFSKNVCNTNGESDNQNPENED
jgi:hypothetical protein